MKQDTYRKIRNVLIRYAVGTLGLFLVAAGAAISIKANLGTSSLSAPSAVLKGTWGLSFGTWAIIVNMTYIIVQLLVLRSRFHLHYLMQIPASLVFGYLIDLCGWLIAPLSTATLASRLALLAVACLVTAMGVSIEVIARAWMLSAEMTVYAFSKVVRMEFGDIKVIMDCVLVVVAVTLSWLLFDNPFGSGTFTSLREVLCGITPGVVIGLGTLVFAVSVGFLMRLTDPLADRMMDAIAARVVKHDGDAHAFD